MLNFDGHELGEMKSSLLIISQEVNGLHDNK